VRKLIKRFILRIISVGQYFRLVNLRHRRFVPGGNHINVNIFFTLLSKKSNPVSFIQIGANDGVKNDPIFPFVKQYQWKGILVEPLPDFFEKLVSNYHSSKNLTFENIGISDHNGEMDFYFLPSEYSNPEWLQQIGTFDKEAIEFNLANFPELIDKIERRKIQTFTLKHLLEKNQVLKMDLLIIDAEGFEYKILKQLEQLTEKPSYILFEWGCMKENIQKDLFNFLRNQKYKLYSSSGDVLAVYKD
jgi:FkbM family methyltransferase